MPLCSMPFDSAQGSALCFFGAKDRQNKKAPANCNLPELFDFSTHQLSDCKARPE
jgi:hypothetical protein